MRLQAMQTLILILSYWKTIVSSYSSVCGAHIIIDEYNGITTLQHRSVSRRSLETIKLLCYNDSSRMSKTSFSEQFKAAVLQWLCWCLHNFIVGAKYHSKRDIWEIIKHEVFVIYNATNKRETNYKFAKFRIKYATSLNRKTSR